MSGWIIVEHEYPQSKVDVLNLSQVLDFYAFNDKSGRVIVEVYSDAAEHLMNIELQDWNEVEKLINTLPAIDNLGWIYIVDGRVQAWKGKLKLLSNAEEGQQ